MTNDLINPKLFNVQSKITNKQYTEIKQSVYHAIDKIKSMTSKEFPFAIIFTTDDGESLSSKYNPDELSLFHFCFEHYLQYCKAGKKALDDFLQSLDSFSSEYKTLAKCDTDSPQFKKNQQELKEKLKSLCSHLNNASFMFNKFHDIATNPELKISDKLFNKFSDIVGNRVINDAPFLKFRKMEIVSMEESKNDNTQHLVNTHIANLYQEEKFSYNDFDKKNIAKIATMIEAAQLSPIVENAEVSLLHESSSGICKPCCCSIL